MEISDEAVSGFATLVGALSEAVRVEEPPKVPSYTSPKALGHKLTEDINMDRRVVQEKLDGSQFSFMKTAEGELLMRSRGKQIILDKPEKMFNPVVEYVKSIADRLATGFVYRGEAVCKPKHNTLCYNRAAKGGFVLFDIEDYNLGPGNFVDHTSLGDWATALGVDVAPVYRVLEPGVEYTSGMFEEDFRRESVLGGVIEGVVIKNYSKFFPDGKLMAAKWVSDSFKEKHRTEWKKSNPGSKDIANNIITSLAVEARYQKAVQHLAEEGKLTDTPKDIGAIMKEVHEDVLREEKDYIKETLYKHFRKHIMRGITAPIPSWYKAKLGIVG